MSTRDIKDHGFFRFALRYGVRNLRRNPRRTVITIGTVALSVTVTLVGMSYADAVLAMWEQGSIDHGTAHAQLHTPNFHEQRDPLTEESTLADDNEAERALKSDPRVERTSRRLKFEGVISAVGKTVYFLGLGIEPEHEIVVSPGLFNKEADEGTFVTPENPRGIVVGKGLAETLGVAVGDDAVLLMNTVHGGVNAVDVVIAGTSDLPLPTLSKRLLYMHFDTARESLELENRYSELAVRLQDRVEPTDWVENKRGAVKSVGGALLGWWEIDPLIKDVERLTDSLIGVICLLLFISAGISVLNIVFMLVAERTVEIGTLMAIGAKTKAIYGLFTTEAAVLGVFGGVIGGVIGNVIIAATGIHGVSFANPFGSGTLIIYPQVNAYLTTGVFLAAVGICFVAALAPARKAASLEPVVAFRGQMT